MGHPQLRIEDTLLDNGTWRQTVGNLAVTSDDLGKVHTVAIEFIIQSDADGTVTASERFADAFVELSLKSPRVKAWFDSELDPVVDWYVGDNVHTDIVTNVSLMSEMPQTTDKLHCVLTVTALAEIARAGVTPITGSVGQLAGLKSELTIAKVYFDSRRYTTSVSGVFGGLLDEDANGPFNLDAVANNGGRARFVAEMGSSLPAFEEGMILQASGSGYGGKHQVTGISGLNIDTKTLFEGSEGDVGATFLIGENKSAEENLAEARATILEEVLGTGPEGDPNDDPPHLELVSEQVSFVSERHDMLEFMFTAAPRAFKTGLTSGSPAESVDRGLNYVVSFTPPEKWDSRFAPPPVQIAIVGTVAINDKALAEKTIYEWWEEIEEKILAEVEAISEDRFSNTFRKVGVKTDIDYNTNDVHFAIACLGNYTGTISYSRTDTFSSKKQFTIWEDTDGYDHVQQSPAPPRKTCVVRISWLGESPGGPGSPGAPTESGFQYILEGSGVTFQEDLEAPDGVNYRMVESEYTYIRVRTREGASGSGSFGAGGSIAGLTGGMFGSGLGGTVGAGLSGGTP